MREYTFVGASLPKLVMGIPPEITFTAFARLLRVNLAPEDLKLSRVMRRYWDYQNVRLLWKDDELQRWGNYNENELEEAVVDRQGFPDYFYRFTEKYDAKDDRLANFSELIASYFREENPNDGSFLQQYLDFERGWRLVFAGFRAKEFGKDLTKELQFEDRDDDLVAQIMAQKDAGTYEPPARFEELKGIFNEHGDAPLELEQALCQWRSKKYEQMGGQNPFALERILAYQARLVVAEKWMQLDREKGMKTVEIIEGRV